MALAPALPAGIAGAIELGRPVTAGDIAGNGANNTLPIDASSLIGARSRVDEGLGVATGDVNAARSAGVGGAGQIAAGAMQGAQGSIAGTMADLATIEGQKARNAAIIGRWGTDPSNPSMLIAQFASSIQAEAMDIHSQRQGINAKLSQPFLDNPVQWLMNQITVPFELDELRSKHKGMEQDLDVLSKLREASREEIAQNASTTFALTSAKAASAAQIALGEVTKISGQANMQLGSTLAGIAGVEDRLIITDFGTASTLYRDALAGDTAAYQKLINLQGADVQLQQLGLSKQQLALAKDRYGNIDLKQLEIQAAHLGISRVQLDLAINQAAYKKVIDLQDAARRDELGKLQVEIAGAQSADLNKKMAADNALDARVEKLNSLAGTKFTNWKELAAIPDSKEKTILMQLVTDPSFQQGSALSVIGPAEALAVANGFRLPLGGPGEDMVRKRLTEIQSAYIKSLGPGISAYSPEQRMVMIGDEMKKQIQTELKDIKGTGSIFSPPSLSITLQLPGIQGSKLSAMLIPLTQNPDGSSNTYATEAKDVIAAANQLIATGKATPSEMAAEVSNFYSQLALNADASHGYRKFTLPSPLSERTWNSTVPSESSYSFSGVVTHNLMSRVEMETYFTRLTIKKLGTIPYSGQMMGAP